METHDPLCRQQHWDGGDCFDCRLIAKVRADEQERFARWKDEATEVMREWERVWVALGSPGRLGESKAAAALAMLDGRQR